MARQTTHAVLFSEDNFVQTVARERSKRRNVESSFLNSHDMILISLQVILGKTSWRPWL